MRDSDPADETWKLERRSALKLTAGLVATGTFVGSATAGGSGAGKTVTTCRMKQGDHEVEIEPLSGDEPVEELYDYRLPDEYEGDGATTGEGQYYRSVGTESLQRNATSIMFLYDGPNGLSFVVVHDALDGDGGGSVSWEVTSVPTDADWIVKDDYYVDAESGESVETNYDNWHTDGSDHTVDWTWMKGRTDGGVLGYFGEDFSFTVHPAFNEKAALYGDHYDGDIENWEMLSGDLNSPDRISLDLDAAVTVSCTTETKKGDGKNGKTEEEKRREEIEEKQDEVEAEIEKRRKEMEAKIENRREEITADVEAEKADVKSKAEEKSEEISEKVEKGADRDETKTRTEISERFEADVDWNSSDDE